MRLVHAALCAMLASVTVSAGSLVLEQGSIQPGGTVLNGQFLNQIAIGGIDIASGFDPGSAFQLEGGALPIDGTGFLNPAFSITGIKPASAAPGSAFTVSGLGLRSVRGVLVGKSPAKFSIVDDNTLLVYMPSNGTGGQVSIVSLWGKAISQIPVVAELPNALPQISSVSPASEYPADPIIIKGTNFLGTTNVVIGKVSASFQILDNGTIRAIAPPAVGPQGVVVQTLVGTVASSSGINVLPPLVPPVISGFKPPHAAPGSQVALMGSHLNGISSIKLNGTSTIYSIQDDSHTVFTVPDGASSGAIWVQSSGGSTVASQDFTVDLPPTLAWIDSDTALQGQPGDHLVLRGGALLQAQQVFVNGVLAPFVPRSATELEIEIPSGATSGQVTLMTPNGSITSEQSLLVILPGAPPPAAPRIDPTGVVLEDGTPGFQFHADANVPYHVDFIDDLGTQFWAQSHGVFASPAPHDVDLGNIVGTDAVQRYFRVVAGAQPFDNWDFEQGLSGWTASGSAFTNQPTFGECYFKEDVNAQPIVDAIGGDYWNTRMHIGHHGDWWIGTGQLHKNADSPALANPSGTLDAQTGSLQSPLFKLDHPFLTFLIGGRSSSPLPDAGNIRPRIELQVLPSTKQERTNWSHNPFFKTLKDGYFIVTSSTLINSDQEFMRREVWDVTSYTNHSARIAILDPDPNGHINADDFRFSSTDPRPDLILARVSGSTPIYRDPDAPVWGFADTHAHPASFMGFGGQLIAGKGDLPPEIALQSCEYAHGFNGANIKVPNYSNEDGGAAADALSFFTSLGGLINTPTLLMDEFAGFGGHRTSGYQYGFDGWPSIAEMGVHPQMYIDWIRRAWEGGLRLMVAHSVHTRLLSELNGNDGSPLDDIHVAEAQLIYIRNLAARHSDFMEVALTPRDARRIIHQGKLALVLGIESDEVANMGASSAPDAAALTNYLSHIYRDLGVRHVFPVHLADNAYAGCAIYNAFWNDNNWFLNLALFDARQPEELGIPDRIDFRLPPTDFADVLGQFGYSIGALLSERFFPPQVYFGRAHANARTLTPFGETLIQEMMRRGMIIDTDHSGYLTRSRILDLAQAQNYPVVSGHCGFTELSLATDATTDLEKLSAESDNTPTIVGRLAALGAMASPITLAKDTRTWGSAVPNDCPGSSKTWAQQYLYAVDKFGGRNVGLATDYGLTHGIGPRFGFNAFFGAKDDALKTDFVLSYTLNQSNGVRYIEPIGDYRSTRFEGWLGSPMSTGPLPTDTTPGALAGMGDFYQAMALYSSGVDPDAVPYPRPPDRPRFLARGMRAVDQTALNYAMTHDLPLIPGNSPDEVRAGYYAVHGLVWSDTDSDYFRDLVANLSRLWRAWQKIPGNNRPMHRCQMNCIVEADSAKPWVKEWDFNFDGLAHYGLLPDFIQDLKNVGVDSEKLRPLFNSAEDYIRVWERCEANRLQ